MKAPSDSTTDKLIKVGIVAAILFFGKKALAKAAKDSADNQVDTTPAAGQARALNAAMNPSGNNWMRSFDGTNKEAIYDTAKDITDLDAVKDFYKEQTEGRNLFDDLTNEIGADGFNKFLAIASKGKTGSPKYATVRKDILPNRWVITKADANIRKTAKKESKLNPFNNIVKMVPKGRAIGVSTGNFAYDEPNDVTFIEFYTLGAKVAGKHFFYVANSQVELITKEEKAKRDKASKIPFELLAGLSGFGQTEEQQIVSIRATMIYDEQLNPVTTVARNIIIGFPLMVLDTGKGKRIKLQTVQGNIRWVSAQDVRTENRL